MKAHIVHPPTVQRLTSTHRAPARAHIPLQALMGLTIQAVTQASVASVLDFLPAAVQAAQSIYTVVLLQQPAVLADNNMVVALAQASVAVQTAIIALPVQTAH